MFLINNPLTSELSSKTIIDYKRRKAQVGAHNMINFSEALGTRKEDQGKYMKKLRQGYEKRMGHFRARTLQKHIIH